MKMSLYAFLTLLFLLGCSATEMDSLVEQDVTNSPRTIAEDFATALPSLTATAELYTHEMFVEASREGFSIIESESPTGTLLAETSNSTGEYRAFVLLDSSALCFVYFEEYKTNTMYVIKSPDLNGNRCYTDLVWFDDNLLEFTVVNQPHHGVRYTVDIETSELINAVPVPLD